MEIVVDNRIILALAEVAGSEERDLNNIFVFGKEGEAPIFFATDGYIAMKVQPAQGEFNFNGDFVFQVPVLMKKVLKYNKKELNDAMNTTVFKCDEKETTASFYNGQPFELYFSQPETPKFEKMPEVWNEERCEKGTIAFNPMLANKLGKAIVKLGFPSMQTFLLQETRMRGTKQNEEFIAEYILMGGRVDEECE